MKQDNCGPYFPVGWVGLYLGVTSIVDRHVTNNHSVARALIDRSRGLRELPTQGWRVKEGFFLGGDPQAKT